MPTRSQVDKWDLGALEHWAATLVEKNGDCLQHLDKAKKHFTDVRDDWSGAAYNAAYDRVLEDHDQGRKLTVEVEDLAEVLVQAVATLVSYRTVLLGKVADAEGAALTVADDWRVSGSSEETVDAHQGLINSAYFALNDAVSDVARRITTQADIVRSAGDLLGSGLDVSAAEDETGRLGQQDGQAMADWADAPVSMRDPAVLDRIASQLPPHPLTDAELKVLAEGGEVDSLPEEVQDYYRQFYNSAGKEGVLALSEHLRVQEEAGNTVAAAQRDSLANGLAIISNEDIGTGRGSDGRLLDAGSYQAVPQDIRELLEARVSDDSWPGAKEHGPAWAKQVHLEEASQLASLVNQADPGYQPGAELGTQMYLKAADMVENPDGGRYFTDISQSRYDGTAGGLAEFAGRNNDAAHRIWTGEGMPEGYDSKETVRALTGYDWSESDKGRGAATLIDRITEESQLPPDDPRGHRGRAAFVEMGEVLASEDVWENQKEGFANSPELATSVSKALAANLDAVSTPGRFAGYGESIVLDDGRVELRASEANRLLQLGGYSEEGRLTLTAAAEQRRIEELTEILQKSPEKVPNALAASDAGTLQGRIDQAISDALVHQDQLKGEEALNPTDALHRAKMVGATIAGEVTNELAGKVPGVGRVTGMTGVDPGELMEGKVQEWLGKPEYEYMELPDKANLVPEAVDNAHQSILNAAYGAGTLPSELHTPEGPVDIRSINSNSQMLRVFNDFLEDHKLSQYVKDYEQSYANRLVDQKDQEDDE
ncbi:hypothetical protein ACL02S_10320 [Nocardia sp. 004]|uniref:TPR repeat region-containing protein n=1 Tax=Nocardia sp. 004 TaxID=3385978 RepID=UPI0039A36CDC